MDQTNLIKEEYEILPLPEVIDYGQYKDKTTKIASYETLRGKYGVCVKVITEALDEKGEVTASRIYNLTENEEGKAYPASNGVLGEFMRRHNIMILNDIVGLEVTTAVKDKEGLMYLEFN